MKFITQTLIAVSTFLVLLAGAHAASPAPAPLTPAAQEAIDKGIIAAKVPDYQLAIRYFDEARKLAPQAPVVHLNMGLAESRIPGRELRAMAWFGAYLAAHPDAPNAAAVKEQIGVLEVRNQSNVSRLLKTVQDAANQMSSTLASKLKHVDLKNLKPNPLYYEPNPDLNPLAIVSALSDIVEAQIAIAKAQIGAGDIASAQMIFIEAQRIAELIPVSAFKSKWASEAIASAQVYMTEVQLKAGDISDAQKTSELIRDADWKNKAQRVIARAQIKAGDFSGAQKTANLLHPQWKGEIQSMIAAAQVQTSVISASDVNRKPASGTQSADQPAVLVADWLKKLDDDNKGNDCPLNTAPFLDLAVFLKSLSSDDAKKTFKGMFDVAEKIVSAQNVITGMLKQQDKK